MDHFWSTRTDRKTDPSQEGGGPSKQERKQQPTCAQDSHRPHDRVGADFVAGGLAGSKRSKKQTKKIKNIKKKQKTNKKNEKAGRRALLSLAYPAGASPSI